MKQGSSHGWHNNILYTQVIRHPFSTNSSRPFCEIKISEIVGSVTMYFANIMNHNNFSHFRFFGTIFTHTVRMTCNNRSQKFLVADVKITLYWLFIRFQQELQEVYKHIFQVFCRLINNQMRIIKAHYSVKTKQALGVGVNCCVPSNGC